MTSFTAPGPQGRSDPNARRRQLALEVCGAPVHPFQTPLVTNYSDCTLHTYPQSSPDIPPHHIICHHTVSLQTHTCPRRTTYANTTPRAHHTLAPAWSSQVILACLPSRATVYDSGELHLRCHHLRSNMMLKQPCMRGCGYGRSAPWWCSASTWCGVSSPTKNGGAAAQLGAAGAGYLRWMYVIYVSLELLGLHIFAKGRCCKCAFSAPRERV